MPEQTHSKTKASVNSDELTIAINAVIGSKTVVRMGWTPADALEIVTSDTLSGGEQTNLDTEVTNHTAGAVIKKVPYITEWCQEISMPASTVPYLKTASITYDALAMFIFKGSDKVGVPIMVSTTIQLAGGTDLDIRLYDVDNANVICEKVDLTGATMFIHNFMPSDINNIPTSSSIFEIQLLATGSGREARCGSLGFHFKAGV